MAFLTCKTSSLVCENSLSQIILGHDNVLLCTKSVGNGSSTPDIILKNHKNRQRDSLT